MAQQNPVFVIVDQAADNPLACPLGILKGIQIKMARFALLLI